MSSLRFARLPGAAVVACLGLGLAAPASPGSVELVPLAIDRQHTSVGFRVRHILTQVSGRFRNFEGTIDFDEARPAASKVSVRIDAASVDTSFDARDRDLRSARFFGVEKFPVIAYSSTEVVDVIGGRGRIKGLLTMHGIAREVVLDTQYLGKAKDPWGNTRYAFHAEARINRKDFGMAWNEVLEAGGVLVGEEVEIVLDVEALPA